MNIKLSEWRQQVDGQRVRYVEAPHVCPPHGACPYLECPNAVGASLIQLGDGTLWRRELRGMWSGHADGATAVLWADWVRA